MTGNPHRKSAAPNPAPLLTVSEVSQRLNIRTHHAYTLCAVGALPHIRVGRWLRFDDRTIEEWIRSGGTCATEVGNDSDSCGDRAEMDRASL